MPAKRIHNDTVRKKYNLRSKPTMVAKDDDNDDENDDDKCNKFKQECSFFCLTLPHNIK